MTLKSELTKLANKYGDTIVAKLDRKPEPVRAVSTGVRAIDLAIGVGGFPRGRITTVFGPGSGGKSTLCLWSIGKLIASGGTGVYIDVEQGGSEGYVYDCIGSAGADIEKAIKENRLVLLRPDTAEQAMDAANALVKHVDLMVIDSISAMLSKYERDADVGKHLMGVKARFQTSEFNKLNVKLGQTNCAMVIVSQIRAAITTFGSYETTTEPNAVKHLASVRMRLSKDKTALKKDGRPVLQPAQVDIKKNKVGVPHLKAGFDILFNKGVCMIRDTFETAVLLGIIRQGGSMYYFPADPELEEWDMKIKGARATINWLGNHPCELERIELALDSH